MMFLFQEDPERNNGIEKKDKTRFFGASCDGVSLCLYLALLAIFASPSPCIKLYGYDFDNIVSTKIYSLDHSTNCDNRIRVSKTKEEGSLIYAEVQPEIKLEISRLLKSIYPLNEGVCRNIWQNKNFAIPGFGDRTFKVNRSVTEKLLRQTSETTYVEEHSQRFTTKNGRKGAMYAEPVEWTSPTGQFRCHSFRLKKCESIFWFRAIICNGFFKCDILFDEQNKKKLYHSFSYWITMKKRPAHGEYYVDIQTANKCMNWTW